MQCWYLVICWLNTEHLDDGYKRGKYSIEIFLTEYVNICFIFSLRINDILNIINIKYNTEETAGTGRLLAKIHYTCFPVASPQSL